MYGNQRQKTDTAEHNRITLDCWRGGPWVSLHSPGNRPRCPEIRPHFTGARPRFPGIWPRSRRDLYEYTIVVILIVVICTIIASGLRTPASGLSLCSENTTQKEDYLSFCILIFIFSICTACFNFFCCGWWEGERLATPVPI